MSGAETAGTTQYLTYKLADEVFALDIRKVREVLDFTTVTKVPRTPEFMRGVINLRGSVVPVVDLRLKFGMPKTEKTVDTCVIITEVTVDNDTAVLGALADSVQEVLEAAALRLARGAAATTVAGRTDAGVHAEGQVVELRLEADFPAEKLAAALNFHLRPHPVAVLAAAPAPAAAGATSCSFPLASRVTCSIG